MPDVESSAIQINITAEDNASSVVENIKNKLNDLASVVDRLSSSWASLEQQLSGSKIDSLANSAEKARGALDGIGKVDLSSITDSVNGVTVALADASQGMKTFTDAEHAMEHWGQGQQLTAAREMAQDLEESAKPLNVVQAVVTEIKENFAGVGDEAKKATQDVDRLAQATENAASNTKTINFNDKVKQEGVTQAVEKQEQISEAVKKTGEETQKSSSALADFFGKMNDSRVSQTASDIDGVAASLGKMVSLTSVASVTINAAVKLWQFRFNMLKTLITGTVNGIKKLVEITGKLMQVTAKVSFYMTKAFGTVMLTPLRLLGNAIGKVVDKLKSMFAGLVRIATYRLFRSVIKMITKGLSDGVTALYQWSKALDQSFSKTMDLYATDQQYLNNSIAAMLEPLLETLIPMLDQAIDKFVELLNKANQFMSALAGKSTWTKAKKVPAEYQEAAESAKKATDDLKRSLMGFDEINRLDKEKTSKGKKGKTVPDYASMFEELPIESEFADLAKTIKKLIKNGEWFEAGATLANKLNELIDSWDVEKAGKLLAKKINGVVDFARGFITTAKWKKLGVKISETLNNFFRNLNAKNIGRLIADNINAAFDFALGFFSTFDGSTFGKRIADLINGFFEELDTATIGDTISAVLTKALDAGIALFSNLNTDAFYNSFITLINRVDFEGIGDKLAVLFRNAVNVIDADKIGAIFNNLIQGVSSFIQNAIDVESIAKLVTSITTTIANVLGNEKTIKEVAKGFETLFKGAITAVGTFITTFPVNDIFNAVTTFFGNINWTEIGASFGSSIKGAIDNIDPEAIGNAISTVFNSAIDLLSAFNEQMDMTGWQKLGYDIGAAIATALNNIDWEKAGETLSDLAAGITGAIKTAIETADKNGELSKAIDDLINNIDWDTITTNLMEIIAYAEEGLGKALVAIGKSIGSVLGSAILDGISSIIPDWLKDMLRPFLNAAHTTYGNIFSGNFAEGGFPSEGEAFIAREAGPELVGTIGGKTAVANNNDIVAAVSEGVYEATTAANASNNGTSNISVSVDGDNLFSFFVKKHNGTVKQTGMSPLYV